LEQDSPLKLSHAFITSPKFLRTHLVQIEPKFASFLLGNIIRVLGRHAIVPFASLCIKDDLEKADHAAALPVLMKYGCPPPFRGALYETSDFIVPE
jgi:hypothetical protein